MTAELGDWLAELGSSEPATAAEVAAALVVVLDSPDPSGLTIVGEPSTPYSADPRETADLAYQLMLQGLQQVRRRVSDVATSRRRGEIRLSAERAAGADAARLDELERDLAAARQSEHVLTEQSQRLQQQSDSYRAAKESAKAIYTAAEAHVRIAEAIQAIDGEPDAEPDAELAQLTAALAAAQERLERVIAQGPEILSLIREQAGQAGSEPGDAVAGERPGTPQRHPPEPRAPRPPTPEGPPAPEPAPGLLELGVDPGGSEIRILFAVEPANTVTLLAVLEGPDAVTEHGPEAVRLAGDLLTEIGDEGWPADIEEVALAGADAFLARFFPADNGSIRRRAAFLAE
jgi:phage shock protein A